MRPIIKSILEWAVAALAALLLFLFIRNFVFRVADVNGHSMEPTLSHGDFVMLSRVGYWFDEPERGDIVAFPFRGNPDEYYIKRVIGLPGDEIDFADSRFLVNGAECMFFPGEIIHAGDLDFPVIIEEGLYFVLGDNRNASMDSRYQAVGLVPSGEMLGRVVIRIWPPGRIGAVE